MASRVPFTAQVSAANSTSSVTSYLARSTSNMYIVQASADTPLSGQAAFLFPGSLSVYVGMLDGVQNLPGVRKMFYIATKVFGFDLLDICLHGPPERLAEPAVAQPVRFMTSKLYESKHACNLDRMELGTVIL